MSISEKTRKALDLKNLQLPTSIPVLKIEVEDYTDSTGEPSLRVLVVLDESVDVQKVGGEAIGDLKFAIRESLRQQGIPLWPYIFLAKPSELAETDEE